MAWFRVDDGFWGHEKVTSLSDSALALWVQSGSWTARYRKDGSLPRDICKRLGRKPRAALELVEAGLWIETSEGFAFHDFEQWQKHIVTGDESKEQAAERQRKRRMSRVTHDERHEKSEETVTRDMVLPPYPILPSLPIRSDPACAQGDDPEPGEPDPEPDRPPEPSRLRWELEELVRSEFSARGATTQKASAGQWLDGCRTVQEALDLGLYADARSALEAFAGKLVDAVAAKKPPALGLALQQVQLGSELKPVAGGRQLSAVTQAALRRAEGT